MPYDKDTVYIESGASCVFWFLGTTHWVGCNTKSVIEINIKKQNTGNA
jgi:hypothetical protein